MCCCIAGAEASCYGWALVAGLTGDLVGEFFLFPLAIYLLASLLLRTLLQKSNY